MTHTGHIVPLEGHDDGAETVRPLRRGDPPAPFGVLHLLPPAPPVAEVRVERLGALFTRRGSERVLQLYGPTGLGKTTLMAAMATRIGGGLVRWLTLHPDHLESEATFGDALASAVDFGAPPPRQSAPPQPARVPARPAERIEQALAALGGGPLVLALDAGSLDIEPFGRVLGQLLHWTPLGFTLWLASRRPCAGMLAELRSPHLVRSVEPAHLLFTAEEVRCHRVACAVQGAASPIAGGWPLAEAVAAEADRAGAEGAPGAECLLDHAGGLLDAAIRDGVWQGLSSRTRTALAETAMLEQVDERFLSRLLEAHPAAPVLHEIAALAPLATVRRGPDGGFSVHPLLRAFAARRLELAEPAHKEQLYRQALLHLAERRAPEAAIALVQDTGDHGLARMAFETFTSTELLRASGYNRVRSALSRLAPVAAEQSGQVSITQAVVAMKEGRFPEARRLLDAVREKLSEESAYQSPSLSRIYTDFVIAQHVLAFHAHTELTEAQLSEGYFWSTYTNDQTNAAFVYALRSLHYLRKGEFAQAQEQVAISRRKYEAATSYYGLGSALLIDAMIALATGRLGQAEALANEARVLFARSMPDDAGLIAVAQCILCEIDLERGRTEGLFERVDAALRDLEACDGWPDAFVIGYRVGTRSALAHGDHARALGLLDRAIRLMRSRGLEDIERYCRTLRAGVLLRSPDGAEAREGRRLARSLSGAAPSKVGWRESDEAGLLEAQDALSDEPDDRPGGGTDDGGAQRTVRLAAVAGALEAGAGARGVMAIRAHLLQARIALADGRRGDAGQRLMAALALAEPEEIVLPFTENGPVLLPAIEAMKTLAPYRQAGRATRSFCAALVRAISAQAQETVDGPNLAPRELQVLQGLARRQATKSIARELDLSASAVKFHLANIYRKLGVNKRAEAVVEARRRGIGLG